MGHVELLSVVTRWICTLKVNLGFGWGAPVWWWSRFKDVDDSVSWFMRMELLDLIHCHFLITANSVGRQPSSFQYFQPLTPLTFVLAATAIHSAQSEYACRTKATVMFSEDEYHSTFCPFPVIKFTPEATALVNHTSVGCFEHHPPHTLQPNFAMTGNAEFLSALLSLDILSSILFQNQFILLQDPSARIGTSASPLSWLPLLNVIPHSKHTILRSSVSDGSVSTPFGAPWSELWILYRIPCCISPLSPYQAIFNGRAYFKPHRYFSAWIVTPQL